MGFAAPYILTHFLAYVRTNTHIKSVHFKQVRPKTTMLSVVAAAGREAGVYERSLIDMMTKSTNKNSSKGLDHP